MTGFAYLIASVCFIPGLRGLSSAETARKGNAGIAGMVIAIVTTLADPSFSFEMIILGVLNGGSIGTAVALKIQMTALPQLVPFFIPWSASQRFCGCRSLFAPEAYGIGIRGNIATASLIEMALGTAIGARSGSIIAFAKLQGIMSGSPIGFGSARAERTDRFGDCRSYCLACDVNSDQAFWAIVAISLLIGFFDHTHWRGDAGGLHAELILGWGCWNYFTLSNSHQRGRFLWRYPQLHHV